jgi:predicted hydrocarbon binding protein
MQAKKETISREEASRQVKSMITRAALIHYAFTKTLIDELGKKKGKALAKKAIELYGKEVGKRVKERTLARSLPLTRENFQDDLPGLGWAEREKVEVEGEKRSRVYTCHLARVWQELGVPELGRIYCFVDQAKYEAFNPQLQCVHIKNVLDGDPYCELVVRPKKNKEQRAWGGKPKKAKGISASDEQHRYRKGRH